jgi:hypothetical protein
LDKARDHRCDQVFRRTTNDLIEERILGVGQKLGRHLGERVEVAVEDRPSQAGARHDIADRQRREWPVEQQLTGSAEDPTPGFI